MVAARVVFASGGENGGLPPDLGDVGDAGVAQPVVEDGGVEVVAVGQRRAGGQAG